MRVAQFHVAALEKLQGPYRSLAKYCAARVRIWWEKYLEIAERSWVFSPQVIVPSGTIFSNATVCNQHVAELDKRELSQPYESVYPKNLMFEYLPVLRYHASIVPYARC
jgi:hypothetical protein